MAALNSFGIIHTAISLIAVVSGALALISRKQIKWQIGVADKIYVVTTFLTCVTGFAIYQHGGFGPAHVLGVITLLVLAIALWTSHGKLFGKFSSMISMVSYSTSFFFHLIPAINETATRLPTSAPLATSPDDPHVKMALGVCFLIYLIGVVLQVRWFNKMKQL